MSILVTGAAGFIGSNYVYTALAARPELEIVALDKLTYAGNLDNFSALEPSARARLAFVRGDICNSELLEMIFDRHDITAVVNFAAESHVDRSIHDAGIFLETNIVGTHTLLDVCRRRWRQGDGWRDGCTFLQVSTDEVYGALGPTGAFTEQTPLDPHNPYSASKAAADLLVQSYYNTYALPVIITRCSNNYGPYQFPEKLIPLMIHNALSHKELPVYGDGKHVRDWIYVEDHCRAVDLVLRQGQPGQVYNIGGHSERQNISVVETILSTLRQRTGDPEIDHGLIRHIADRLGHDRRYAIDSSKLERALGWKPRVPFEQGLARTISWYLDHRDWVGNVTSGEYLRFYEKNYSGR